MANEYGKSLRLFGSDDEMYSHSEAAITSSTYSSGMWLGDGTSLLWEHAGSQGCSRIQGIPTWSWASIKIKIMPDGDKSSQQGAKVQWPKDKRSIELVGRVDSAVMLHVDSSNWLPVYNAPLSTHMHYQYGNERRFSVLHMRGRLLQVSIDARFTRHHAAIVAGLTDHGLEFSRENWRNVAAYKTPDIIAGWASLEHPEYQEDAACRSAQNIVALFMTTSSASRPSMGLGTPFKRHAIFEVIYLRQIENLMYAPCYERIGVGRLFEPGVEKLFKATREESIWLV
jgi:hypothetical protein